MDTTQHRSAYITAVVNQKGGVGKTSTTINLGGALALAGHRVLLVDLDPQGHLTVALKLAARDGLLLSDGLLGKLAPDMARRLAVTHSDADNGGRLDVLPTCNEMLLISPLMYQLKAREVRLKRLLAGLDKDYDHILIDCPPSLDVLTDNALAAADGVVIPVQLEDSTVRALKLLFAQIDDIEESVRTEPLTIHGMVASMVERGAGGQPRSNIARSVLADLEELDGVPVLAQVPRGVPLTEAWREGEALATYAPDTEHAAAFTVVAKVLEAARP